MTLEFFKYSSKIPIGILKYVRTKGFNWSEVHLYRSNFLQNPYFSSLKAQQSSLYYRLQMRQSNVSSQRFACPARGQQAKNHFKRQRFQQKSGSRFKVTLVPEASGLKIQKMKRGVAEPSMSSFFTTHLLYVLVSISVLFQDFFLNPLLHTYIH